MSQAAEKYSLQRKLSREVWKNLLALELVTKAHPEKW